MLVRVDVVKVEARCAERIELRLDLGFQLPANTRQKKHPSRGRHVGAEHAIGINQIRHR